MDTSTYEILKECNSGCRMAVNSIEQLVAYLKNQELQELFSKYKEEIFTNGDQRWIRCFISSKISIAFL